MRYLAFAVLTSCLASLASAQIAPVTPIDSIDFTVDNATRIVTGNLVDYEKGHPDWQFSKVKIAVKETLKGPATPEAQTNLRSPEATFANWKDTAALLLVAMPDGPRQESMALDLGAKNLAVVTEDMKLLRTPEAILKWVRDGVAKQKGAAPRPGFNLHADPQIFKGTMLENVAIDYGSPRRTLVRVPADENLLKQAMDNIRSADHERRLTGIHELALFKSKESIDTLTRLLSDEADWSVFEGIGSAYMTHERYNEVREQAYYTLQNLGLNPTKPMWEDPEGEINQTVAVTWEFPGSSNFAKLPNYTNLRDLYLTSQPLKDAEWAAVGILQKVERLFLDGTNVDDKTLEQLSGMNGLTYLSIRNTAVTDGGLVAIPKFKGLRTLDVGAGISDQAIAALHKSLPRLEVRKEEFDFLAPLHLQRIDLTTWSVNNQLPDSATYRQRLAVRGFALLFPSSRSAEVLDALSKNLPRMGWKATKNGFERDDRPITVHSKRCVVDKVLVNPPPGAFADLQVPRDQSCVVITLNRTIPR